MKICEANILMRVFYKQSMGKAGSVVGLLSNWPVKTAKKEKKCLLYKFLSQNNLALKTENEQGGLLMWQSRIWTKLVLVHISFYLKFSNLMVFCLFFGRNCVYFLCILMCTYLAKNNEIAVVTQVLVLYSSARRCYTISIPIQ